MQIETAFYFCFAIRCQPGGWLLAMTYAEPKPNGRATLFAHQDDQGLAMSLILCIISFDR